MKTGFEPQFQKKRDVEHESDIILDFKEKADIDEESIRRVIVLECGIVNRGGKDIKTLPIGTELILEREPSNEYDRWAILAKTAEGKILGYLPAGKNQSVARMMDAGKRIKAFVADSTEPEYQESLKVFGFGESAQLPLRLFWEIPVKKGEDDG